MKFSSVKDRIINERRQMPESTENKLAVTDEELMLKIIEGDKKSYYTLVNRWNKAIINFFYRSVSDQQLAEDLAQEVFINVWKTKNYNPKAPFYSWLYRIAKNKLIDYYRRKKHQTVSIENNPEILDLNINSHIGHEDKMIALDEKEMVEKTIQGLTEEQRTILLLSKYQKLAYEDIGKIMNCSADTVKVKVFRAVKSFVKKFRETYKDE